ncbi:XisI protein [Moorena sp. SIO3I6]|uniref:XisI protein n=1 Tax=Moorena sp. SIO3I6 TaxID=2607831 RepID=UPI0013FBAFDD|nr:XisI protein [Moorena sp. SIO3I6]NEP21129.1 XisI protein [Moorena sp. SIO3I6]
MDRLDEYSRLIREILERYARISYSHGDIQSYAITDTLNNHFLLMVVGWDGKRRVHACITHVQIIDGKIWIQRDGIEDGITEELVAAGVPKSDIVLGFHPPEVRPHTGYALA